MILEAFTALHSGAFPLLSYMATFEIFTRYVGFRVIMTPEMLLCRCVKGDGGLEGIVIGRTGGARASRIGRLSHLLGLPLVQALAPRNAVQLRLAGNGPFSPLPTSRWLPAYAPTAQRVTDEDITSYETEYRGHEPERVDLRDHYMRFQAPFAF